MKKLLGIMAIGFLFSIPAYGQSKGGGFSTGSAASNYSFSGGSSGGGFGAGSVGNENRANIPSYGPTHFAVAAYSGDQSFTPSGFVSFDQAVQEGNAVLAPQKTVAEAAAENLVAKKAKSRAEFVQDRRGNVVPLPR